jgi:glucose-1-phosphate cytidylyltransferase
MANDTILVAVLCGGKGVRLQPLSDQFPKAMAPIDGRPMLDHILEYFGSKGFDNFTICIGYMGEVIRDHFSTRPELDQLKFSDEGETASMLQRIFALRDEAFENVIVIYGDTFIDLDIDQLLAQHKSSDASITLVTAEMRNPLGEVGYEDDGWVKSFREKPLRKYYIGCMVIKRQCFGIMTPELINLPDGQGLVAFFDSLIDKKKVAAYHHDGVQVSYNTVSELDSAHETMYNFYTYQEETE